MFITDRLLTDLIIGVITLVIAAYFYIKHKYSYWTKRGVPQLEPTFPFGNHTKTFPKGISLGGLSEIYYKEFKKQGHKLGGVYLGLDPYLVVTDAALAKTILTTDFSSFVDRGVFHNKKSPLSNHIISQGGDEWRNSRSKFTNIFTSSKMKFFFNTIKQCSDELAVNLEDVAKNGKADVDIYETMGCFFTDVIGSVTYGVDANSFKSPDAIFRKLGRDVFGTFTWPFRFALFFTICYPKLAKLVNLSSFQPDVEKFFEKFVPEALENRIKNKIHRADFLQLLIEMKNSGVELTTDEIIGQSFIFFAAGFETSSAASALMLYEMAKNPEIQHKVRAEIKQVLSKHGDLTYDAIYEMTYLSQVLNEAMRKYPLLPSLHRVCVKDYQFPDTNVVIEKGTAVIMSAQGWHRDPELFPDPMKFDPDRFEDKNVKYEGYFPFGDGPRNCIGVRLGILQTKIGVAEIVKNYEVSISPNCKEPLELDPLTFVLKLEDPILLRLKKIN